MLSKKSPLFNDPLPAKTDTKMKIYVCPIILGNVWLRLS
jgi:hypothetical protein